MIYTFNEWLHDIMGLKSRGYIIGEMSEDEMNNLEEAYEDYCYENNLESCDDFNA